ncbi:MAG: helical backbone metal receptor, partial [Dehalococcoidia bacterium]|nr:helical backbone metal receptor [Dehalococcoidia bacterium]
MASKRIVSLVPSLTELMWWLGRGDWLAGRTRFCTEPAGAVKRVEIVGGTKNPKVRRIIE